MEGFLNWFFAFIKQSERLTLRELFLLAGGAEAVFFALFLAGVAL